MRKNIVIFLLVSLSFLFTALAFAQTFTKIDTGVFVRDKGPSGGGSWADYDNDGFVDLFVSNKISGTEEVTNFLYHNESNGFFSKIESGFIVTEPGFFTGSCWGDYDNDGFPDLIITERSGKMLLCHNEGNGQFSRITTNSTTSHNSSLWGSNWIDINSDGYLDLFLITRSYNLILQNEGSGDFAKIKHTNLDLEVMHSINGSWAD